MNASIQEELTVWSCDTDPEPRVLEGLRGVLSASERARAAAFRFERDRHRFEARRGQLRHILAGLLDCEPREVTYELTDAGRPILRRATHGDSLAFSASHREGLMLVAISAGLEVGVDVEALRPVPELAALAARVFAASEIRRGLGAGSDVFLRHWTRKEAVLKALGTGLLVDPADAELEPSSPSDSGWIWNARPDLVIRDLDLPRSHVGAVCAPSFVRCIRHHTWVAPNAMIPHSALSTSPAGSLA